MPSPYLQRPLRNLLEVAIDRSLHDGDDRSILFQFLDGMDVAALITDAGFSPAGPRILFANKAFCRMCRYPSDHLKGSAPQILHGPATDLGEAKRFRAELEGSGHAETELVNYDVAREPYRVRLVAGKLRLGSPNGGEMRIGFSVTAP